MWQPNQRLQVVFKTDYTYFETGGYPEDPVYNPLTGGSDSLFDVTSDAHLEGYDQFVRSVLDIRYTFEDGIQLRSVSGYQWGRASSKNDLDGTDFLPFSYNVNVTEKIYSQEFNLISPDSGPFKWVVGAFFQSDTVNIPQDGFDLGFPAGVLDVELKYNTPKKHEALFGQATYDITDALQLQIGARYNHSTFGLTDYQADVAGSTFPLPGTIYTVPCPAPAGGVCSPVNHESNSRLTGKIDVNYKLDSDNFLYAFVATGHKDGALNTTADEPPVVKPENLTDYEIGWKSNLFGEHMRTQIGGFYTDYTDFQVSLPDPATQTAPILNAPKALSEGIEAQGQAVFNALSFDFGGSYIHSEYKSFYAINSNLFAAPYPPCSPSSGPAVGECQNLTGHQLVNSPSWTFNAGVQYAFSLGNGDTLTPRADYAYVGKQWATVFEATVPPLVNDQLGARSLVNAQLGYDHGDWNISAYATNLFNLHYVAALGAGVPYPELQYAGAPRQFGIRVTKTF